MLTEFDLCFLALLLGCPPRGRALSSMHITLTVALLTEKALLLILLAAPVESVEVMASAVVSAPPPSPWDEKSLCRPGWQLSCTGSLQSNLSVSREDWHCNITMSPQYKNASSKPMIDWELSCQKMDHGQACNKTSERCYHLRSQPFLECHWLTTPLVPQ